MITARELALGVLEAAATPMDFEQIAAAINRAPGTVEAVLRELHKAAPKQVHIAEWHETARNPRPAFRVGDSPDASRPVKETAADRILKHLASLPDDTERAMNYRQLAKLTGDNLAAAHRAAAALHAARNIYIARFERSTGSPVPHYLIGNQPDATAPAPLSTSEKQRLSRLRAKKDPKRWAKHLKQRSRRYYARKREEPEEWRKRSNHYNLKRRLRDGRPVRPVIPHPLMASALGFQINENGRYIRKGQQQ